MRDFRDAKTMAHSLRDALKGRAVETTHSECLELIATVFGYDNWNVLSAKIEAAELCNDFVGDLHDEKELARLLEGGAKNASTMSTEDLAPYVERSRKGAERNRLTLRAIQQRLAVTDDTRTTKDDILALPRFTYLRSKSPEETFGLQQVARHQLSRYEEALQLAMTALGARRQ